MLGMYYIVFIIILFIYESYIYIYIFFFKFCFLGKSHRKFKECFPTFVDGIPYCARASQVGRNLSLGESTFTRTGNAMRWVCELRCFTCTGNITMGDISLHTSNVL